MANKFEEWESWVLKECVGVEANRELNEGVI
jgi:hypothetical protein